MKRRQFIEQTTLGVSASFIPSLYKSQTAGDKKLGVALVGLGNYATNQLAPALQQTQHCRLTGIVTGSQEKAQIWKSKYEISDKNIYSYDTFDKIIDNKDIDIVYVVLPNFLHAEYSIRAANAGKHVICEKPMAMNVQECKDMISACEKANVKLSIGYRLYFEPHHLQMRKMTQDKKYGTVKLIESSLGFSMADPKIWRLDKAKGGGGAIMDLGVYCIQGARRILNELPSSVTAQGFVLNKIIFKEIYEGITFQMIFPSGAICNASTTYSSYIDRLYATGDWRSYWLEPSFNATGASGFIHDGKLIPFTLPTKPFQQIDQLDQFALSIKNNSMPDANGKEGLIDMMIIEAVKEAADSGRKVGIDWKGL